MFNFSGNILTSKSWMNRALIIQFFNPHLTLPALPVSDDVVFLKNALQAVGSTFQFELGMGGTSFRFFAFAISRRPGTWTLEGHPQLMLRPQQEIIAVLKQLGVRAEISGLQLNIASTGWKPQGVVSVQGDTSSQFISGLLLSCWNLDEDLEIEIRKPVSSFGYLRMTIEALLLAGMNLQVIETDNAYFCRIPKRQKADSNSLQAELDISSAFSLAAAAVFNGQIEITNWNDNSNQPDLAFLEIFRKMNISFEVGDSRFSVKKQPSWNSLNCNLNNSPDLFPVLAVVCAFAEGTSLLTGGSQLKVKESDRIAKTHELLSLHGFQSDVLSDGLRIYGKSSQQDKSVPHLFDPEFDHRMAMAAALFKLMGYNTEIAHMEVVNKSYPDFWKDIGL